MMLAAFAVLLTLSGYCIYLNLGCRPLAGLNANTVRIGCEQLDAFDATSGRFNENTHTGGNTKD